MGRTLDRKRSESGNGIRARHPVDSAVAECFGWSGRRGVSAGQEPKYGEGLFEQ